jgi:hypothetical protein
MPERICPHCQRTTKADVEVCPGCGAPTEIVVDPEVAALQQTVVRTVLSGFTVGGILFFVMFGLGLLFFVLVAVRIFTS